jgi:hypothetical protein
LRFKDGPVSSDGLQLLLSRDIFNAIMSIMVCCCLYALQDAPVSLDGLQLLLSRESAKEPAQTYLISFSGPDAASSSERRITDFPHPYPQVTAAAAAAAAAIVDHVLALKSAQSSLDKPNSLWLTCRVC